MAVHGNPSLAHSNLAYMISHSDAKQNMSDTHGEKNLGNDQGASGKRIRDDREDGEVSDDDVLCEETGGKTGRGKRRKRNFEMPTVDSESEDVSTLQYGEDNTTLRVFDSGLNGPLASSYTPEQSSPDSWLSSDESDEESHAQQFSIAATENGESVDLQKNELSLSTAQKGDRKDIKKPAQLTKVEFAEGLRLWTDFKLGTTDFKSPLIASSKTDEAAQQKPYLAYSIAERNLMWSVASSIFGTSSQDMKQRFNSDFSTNAEENVKILDTTRFIKFVDTHLITSKKSGKGGDALVYTSSAFTDLLNKAREGFILGHYGRDFYVLRDCTHGGKGIRHLPEDIQANRIALLRIEDYRGNLPLPRNALYTVGKIVKPHEHLALEIVQIPTNTPMKRCAGWMVRESEDLLIKMLEDRHKWHMAGCRHLMSKPLRDLELPLLGSDRIQSRPDE